MTRIRNDRPHPGPGPPPKKEKPPKAPRKRMKQVSDKRKVANNEYKLVREIYLRENPLCCYCGLPATEIHHLCSGGNRAKSLVNSDTWMGLCYRCHLEIQHGPIAEQVATKVDHILRTINRLRGRAKNAITLKDLL